MPDDGVWFYGCPDDPPFLGVAAILACTAAVAAGVLIVGGTIAGVSSVRQWWCGR